MKSLITCYHVLARFSRYCCISIYSNSEFLPNLIHIHFALVLLLLSSDKDNPGRTCKNHMGSWSESTRRAIPWCILPLWLTVNMLVLELHTDNPGVDLSYTIEVHLPGILVQDFHFLQNRPTTLILHKLPVRDWRFSVFNPRDAPKLSRTMYARTSILYQQYLAAKHSNQPLFIFLCQFQSSTIPSYTPVRIW